MSYYEYVKRRIQYSSVTRLVLEILAKVGLNLRPFVLFRESNTGNDISNTKPDIESIEIRYLEREDMHLLTPFSRHPGRDVPKSTLDDRLNSGNRCAALFIDNELAAFSWCDFERCSFDGYSFKLRENEVYLFDAYTPVSFRGKGLAAHIRRHLYRELARQGYDIYYSFSDLLNRPAVRFKEKLRAEKIVTGYFLVLFSRWQFTFFIRKIDANAPSREI
jgi:GNAT superfamily N-acetyltransferase